MGVINYGWELWIYADDALELYNKKKNDLIEWSTICNNQNFVMFLFPLWLRVDGQPLQYT
jgi:hypothetical protein